MLERLDTNEIESSSRCYPGILSQPDRESSNKALEISDLSAVADEGEILLKGLTFNTGRNDEIISISRDLHAMTALFETISGNRKA